MAGKSASWHNIRNHCCCLTGAHIRQLVFFEVGVYPQIVTGDQRKQLRTATNE